MIKTINQHYIQQFYLKRFANTSFKTNNSFLRVNNGEKAFIENVRFLCCENYFYENNNFNENYFEKQISKMETAFISALNRLLKVYNQIADRNKRSVYSINSFGSQIKLEKTICIFKYIMLVYIRTKKIKDTFGEETFFHYLNDIINMNNKDTRQSCFYKNHNIYLCINNTNVDLLINDINLYFLKNNNGQNIMVHNINKKLFLLIINRKSNLSLNVDENFINKINDCCKTQFYKYYFETPTQTEIINYELNEYNK